MPGWPDRGHSQGTEVSKDPWPRKVSISWGLGNKLRVSYLSSEEAPAAPSKVVEVRVGPSGADSVKDATKRRLLYDSLPAFALLQTRKKEALQSLDALPLDWWETVLEYSRSISAVLGPNKSLYGVAIRQPVKATKEIERPSAMKAIWDLLEIIYVDKHALSWLTEQLVNWLEGYDSVLLARGQTVYSKLVMLQPILGNMRFPEDDGAYWDSIASAVAVGWLDVVVKCLRMHGSYQHDQIDNRQTENGLVEAVAVLISQMPRMSSSSKSDILGVSYTYKPDFSKARERWRHQIAKLNASSFWLECTHERTVNGLKRVLSILLGDVNALVSATHHWMELLVAHFLFMRPLLSATEGLLNLVRKCTEFTPPAEDDQLLELLLAILGENTEVVLVECRKLFDPWMVTHVAELLLAKNYHAQSFLMEGREVLDGMSLEEFHRLVYAQVLSSHPCTWQLAPFYLASCPLQGRCLLESMLLKQPVSGDSRVPLKVLDICRMYELGTVADKYMRILGVHHWKHGRKGMGISWLQRARAYDVLSVAAKELLSVVSETSIADARRLQELDGLIDLLEPQFEGFGGLSFLHRFRDFKVTLYNFQEARTSSSLEKQAMAGKEAAQHLMQLMKGGVAPQQFLPPLLQDSVELLEFSGEVLFTAAETNVLLCKLQNFLIFNDDKDPNSGDKVTQSVGRIRLALAHNLGRAILKE